MNTGENVIIFNEEKARDLVYYLLENDSDFFKKLIPEIRAMDSESFENLFRGTPFKEKNNEDGNEYKVHDKKQFENLLAKFDNFSIILDEWYLDKRYYEYIKDLWINNINIENLRKENENGIDSLLNSFNIDYKNWPDNVKDDFKKKIRKNKNQRILKTQIVGELRNKLDKIICAFNEHKEKIHILPDNYKESLEKINEIISLIYQDYSELEELMVEIKANIEILNKNKNKSTLGLIGSGILGFAGIAGGILALNGFSIAYGISGILNTFAAFRQKSTINESQELVKYLCIILEDAMNQGKKIQDVVDDLKMITSKINGQLANFIENQTIKN